MFIRRARNKFAAMTASALLFTGTLAGPSAVVTMEAISVVAGDVVTVQREIGQLEDGARTPAVLERSHGANSISVEAAESRSAAGS